MITVWSVLWGDKYSPEYVYALRDAVRANLSVEHRFRCLTNHTLEGIETRRQAAAWDGWWQKLSLFSRNVASGPCLYFDLDTVITGNLDYLVPFTEFEFCAPANWAQSGHGGIQSSVMAWNGTWHEPYEKFNYLDDLVRLWGDQEYLTELRGDNFTKLSGIGSYKYHCRNGLPDWMRVCVFHGLPDPHEVFDPWILKSTSIHSRIRSNTPNGGGKDLESTASR